MPFLSFLSFLPLQDELLEVDVVSDVGEVFADVVFIDDDVLSGAFGGVEGDIGKDFLKDGIESAGADIFGSGVGFFGEGSDFAQAVFGEMEGDVFSGKQGVVLLLQGIVRFGEDAVEFLAAEGLEFHAQGGSGPGVRE